MALYFKPQEDPVWLTSLEGMLSGLGRIGTTAIQSAYEKQAKQKRKQALAQAGYPEDIAEQIASGGEQPTSQAIQQKYQEQQQQQKNLQYVNAQRMMQGLPPIQLSGQQQQEPQQQPLGMLEQLGPKPLQSPEQAQMQRQEQQQVEQEMKQQRAGKQPSQEDMFDLAVLYGQMTPQQAMKAKQDLKKQERKEEEITSRETLKWREKQLDKKEAIEQNLDRLKILKDISKSGELDSSTWTSALKAIGLGDVKAFQGAKAQEYNKVIADFISSANAMFPGKVTDAKLKMFMQRLPTADLDPEARKEILKDLEYFMKSELATPTAMLELLKENKGKPFPGIMEATAERAAQIRDRYEPFISFLDEEPQDKENEERQLTQPTSGGILEGLKDIPRVAAQGLKGAAQVPIRAAEFVGGFFSKPELPKDYYKGRGLTPEQEARSEAVMKLGPKPKLSESIEHITPKPKTALGKQAGEYAETLGSLLVPLPGMQSFGLTKAGLSQAAKQAGVGQIAKWASQQIGFGEKGGEGFKLGAMLATSLLGRKGPITEANKIYDIAKKHLPLEAKSSTAPLHKIAKVVEDTFDPNIMKSANSQKVYNEMLTDFYDLIEQPKVTISKIWEFKRKIPEMVKQASQYSDSASNPFYKMSNELSTFLKKNPEVPKEASRAIKIGDDLWSGYNNVLKTFNTIKDASLGAKSLVTSTAALLGIASKPLLALGTAATGAVIASKTGYAFLKEMLTNPSIRHHYAKTVQLAAREAKGPLIKQIHQLNLAVKNQEKKRKNQKP